MKKSKHYNLNETFIAGIYNYCDRWCERCAFTDRCRNYAATEEKEEAAEMISPAGFIHAVQESFTNAIELLHKIAAEQGIDLNNLPDDENRAFEDRQQRIKNVLKKNPLPGLCKAYQQHSRTFFDQQFLLAVGEAAAGMDQQVQLGLKKEAGALEPFRQLREAEEIIRWYLVFIDVKLQRALQGKMEEEEDGPDHAYPRDSDGSAKIALLAIERSMKAWTLILRHLPDAEDAALQALAVLSKVRTTVLNLFPLAMAFKRPGFDD